MHFDYGQRVTPGQILFVMDDFDLAQRRREAESGYLKAVQTGTEMVNWDRSPDVMRARRAVQSAANDLRNNQSKMEETKALLDRGLVPRNEYDGLQQQEATQRLALTGAQQDLEAALARGRGPNRQAVMTDLEGAQARLRDLEQLLGSTIVRAKIGGVILKPPASKENAAVSMHAGARLNRGQAIALIGEADGLAVEAMADEIDANRISEGQAVMVTGPAFGENVLTGRVERVAAQASTDDSSSSKAPRFPVRVRLDPVPEAARQRIRFGMSANVAITLYQNPSAIVVPPGAVKGMAPQSVVTIEDASGRRREVRVKLGEASVEGVEILSGLKPGDKVIVPAVPAPAIPGMPTP
jgi:multidrug resistance efflux pump